MIRRSCQGGWSIRVSAAVQRPNGTTPRVRCGPARRSHTAVRQRSQMPLLLPPMTGLGGGPTLQSSSEQASNDSSSSSGSRFHIADAPLSAQLREFNMQRGDVTSAEDGKARESDRSEAEHSQSGHDRRTPAGGGDDDDDGGSRFTTSLAVASPPGMRHPHYFDTYHIFSQLRRAGFTDDQAKVLMKCIRGLLTDELLRAKETYLSSAEMENEAYLFDAACSELRTEIQNNRKSQALLAQTETAALQREFFVLKSLFEEEIDYMKNEVSMDLNERKNGAKIDSRATELQIQELNNRITIAISSDLRSEVEASRWQTTRRGLFTIGVVAALILIALSYRKDGDQQHSKAAATATGSTGPKKPDNISETDVLYIT
ncbi:hypothetical protein V1525DRAFT_353791 [Lipomyces kononenkoae]|uniref:Uncharacterized protein n=1 Tax=Lipomyces kononenkoae TaxID=34357 RepID=A0ACC3TAY7_LIPKO